MAAPAGPRRAGALRDRPRLLRFAQRLTLGRAVGAIAGVAVVLTVVAAVLARAVEPETFRTFGEAAWWALQTVSTVGYGDLVPETFAGRLVGAALMLLGVAFVPAITSIVVAVLVAQLQERTETRDDPVEGERAGVSAPR